jgi:hypothetical protein
MQLSKLQRLYSMNSSIIISDEFGRMWNEVVVIYPRKYPEGL